MASNIDTNVSHYSLSELMAIVELQELEPDKIVTQTNKYIKKFKTSNPTLSTFFMEIQSQLLQYATSLIDPSNTEASFVEGFTSMNDDTEEEAIYPAGDKQQTNWYENEALPQDDDENQKDKTTERKQKIEQLIENTFKNVAELNELLKKSDYDWANKMVNSDGDVYDNNSELAESILNVGDNLVDYGKMFRS